MSSYLLVPKDFDSHIYRELNPDLKNLNDDQCRDHYSIHGKKEKRSYFYDLPDGFDINAYRQYNKDVAGLTDKECKMHYIKYGLKENRKYRYVNEEINKFYNPKKYLLDSDFIVNEKQNTKNISYQENNSQPTDYTVPDYFDIDLYKFINADLVGLNDFQLKMHYIEKGIHEKRLHPAMWNSSIDFMFYKKKYNDIRLLENNVQLYDHFYYVGQYENRKINQKYITIKDFGKSQNLGDELFQYAFCFTLAKQYHIDIKFNSKNIKFNPLMNKVFNIEFDYESEGKSYLLKENGISYQNSLTKIERKIFMDSSIKCIELDGQFKSYKYFENEKKNLLSVLSFNESIEFEAYNFINTVKENNFSLPIVGIDFRMNSLKNYHSYGPPINFSFVEESLKYIRKRINNFVVICVTDQDSEILNKFFKETLALNQTYYITHLEEGSDMCVLKQCDHLIISNSSFGWWSAYLNDKPDKIVITKSIVGQNYFFDNVVPSFERNDILCPDWIQLENDLYSNTYDIIYSTPYMNMTLQETKLFKTIELENKDYLYQTYEYGIVIPIFDYVDTLKILLLSVQREFDINYSRVVLILVMHNESNELVEKLLEEVKFSKISVFKMICAKKHNIRYYDSNQENAFPISSKIVFDICFRIGCEYVINLLPNVVLSNVFLNSIDKYLSTIHDSFFLITTYNVNDSKKEIQTEDSKQCVLNSVDGKFMLFNKDTFYKLLQNKMFNLHYEYAFGESIKNNNGKIYAIKQTYYNPSALNKSIVVIQG